MKKTLVFLALLVVPYFLGAQEVKKFWEQKGFFHMNYSMSNLSQENESLNSYAGGGFTIGTSMYFHKKPIAKAIKLGLDCSILDVNYELYRIQHVMSDREPSEYFLNKVDLSFQLGPSITINPFGKVGLKVYAKAAPSLTFFAEHNFMEAFCLYQICGVTLSVWGIGVGLEHRVGAGKNEGIIPFRNYSGGPFDMNSEGYRAYLCFRFK